MISIHRSPNRYINPVEEDFYFVYMIVMFYKLKFYF